MSGPQRLKLDEVDQMLIDYGWKFSDSEQGVWGYVKEDPEKLAVINFAKDEQDPIGVSVNVDKTLLEISIDYADEILIKDALDIMDE